MQESEDVREACLTLTRRKGRRFSDELTLVPGLVTFFDVN